MSPRRRRFEPLDRIEMPKLSASDSSVKMNTISLPDCGMFCANQLCIFSPFSIMEAEQGIRDANLFASIPSILREAIN